MLIIQGITYVANIVLGGCKHENYFSGPEVRALILVTTIVLPQRKDSFQIRLVFEILFIFSRLFTAVRWARSPPLDYLAPTKDRVADGGSFSRRIMCDPRTLFPACDRNTFPATCKNTPLRSTPIQNSRCHLNAAEQSGPVCVKLAFFSLFFHHRNESGIS